MVVNKVCFTCVSVPQIWFEGVYHCSIKLPTNTVVCEFLSLSSSLFRFFPIYKKAYVFISLFEVSVHSRLYVTTGPDSDKEKHHQ